MVKAKLPKLGACLSAGKGWSGKTGAATSTTCLDRRGEVVAYQECQPAAGVSPMTCKVVTPGDPGGSQENASNQ
jgi:hypothetical protein